MNTTMKNNESIFILIPGTENHALTDRQINNRIAKLEEIKAQEKALKEARAALEEEIQSSMGDTEHIQTGKYTVNWTRVTSTRIDTTRLKKELPDIAEKYAKQQTTRRFSYSCA